MMMECKFLGELTIWNHKIS